MYGGPPYAPHHQQQFSPPGAGQIAPGALTYTTSTGPDGRVVYRTFKAVPASYQTPNGIVSGIQWIPAEATQVLPPGAQPATSDFNASWNRGSKDDQRALVDWQRDADKRRKKEEKEAAKRLREQERMGNVQTDVDYELRKARERDAQSMMARERRKSTSAGAPPSGIAFPGATSGQPGYPSTGSTGYPASPYQTYPGTTPSSIGGSPYDAAGYNRERKLSTGVGYDDLSRQFDNMGLRDGVERERKVSALGRPRKYSSHGSGDGGERQRTVSGNYMDRPAVYGGAGPYVPASGPYPISRPGSTRPYPVAGSPYSNSSPNMRPSEVPYSSVTNAGYPGPVYPSTQSRSAADSIVRSTTPFGPGPAGQPAVYPRGHVMEGQPIAARSRATTPIPGQVQFPPQAPVAFPQSNASPHMGHSSPNMTTSSALGRGPPGTFPGSPPQLAAPEGFSRPINASLHYTPFETMKIQDMEEFRDHLPRMPLVLSPHDVFHEDWIRFMQDLALAWAGRLPVPAQSPHQMSPSALAADLIDLWNKQFFLSRGVEVILYKGRERHSGPNVGTVDNQLPHYDESDSLSSSDDDVSDIESYISRITGPYGHPTAQNIAEAKRRREAAKSERRQRRKEKKLRRKEKARGNKYALYISCIGRGGPPTSAMPGGYPVVPATSTYPGMQTGHGGYRGIGVQPSNHGHGIGGTY